MRPIVRDVSAPNRLAVASAGSAISFVWPNLLGEILLRLRLHLADTAFAADVDRSIADVNFYRLSVRTQEFAHNRTGSLNEGYRLFTAREQFNALHFFRNDDLWFLMYRWLWDDRRSSVRFCF